MNRNRNPALLRNRHWGFCAEPPWLFAVAAMGCATMAFLAGCASAGRVDTKLFRAGAYAIDVTPETFPISMNGSGPREATGVHDPLYARSLVLDDGSVRIVLAVVDSCMIARDLMDEAKALAARATGIPSGKMLISATHTHSAPTAAPTPGSEPDPAYRKYLIRRIAEGITKANARLAPAQIGWAVGQVPNQVFNRRWLLKPGKILVDPFGRQRDLVQMNPGHNNPDIDRPAGPTDPELPILAVRSPAGRPIAALVNYSLHYVGGVPRLLVSGDYFGAFARRFTEIAGAGPEFVAILSNGTSGDINNNDYSQKERPQREQGEQVARVADEVARVAWKTWSNIRWHDRVPLAVREADLELGVRLPDAEEVARAQKFLAEDGPHPRSAHYARETVILSKWPKTVPVKLQAIRIGELGIAAIPCEVFVEIGLAIKERSPLKPSFTIELANGYNGYLPTPEHHRLGGYETWRARSSYLEVEAAPRILATILRLLDEAAR